MMKALRYIRTLGVSIAVFSMCIAVSLTTSAQTRGKHVPLSVVSDWSHNHLLFPESKDFAVSARVQREARWKHSWYIRHTEAWWPEYHPRYRRDLKASGRDWSTTLGSAAFEPAYDFNFSIGGQTGFGSLNTLDQNNGSFLAAAGSVTVTGAADVGTYPLYPGGPSQVTSPSGAFLYDNLLFPTANPVIDNNGPLFRDSTGFEVNIWSNGANSYEFDAHDGSGYHNDVTGAPFNLNADPSAGQTFPAKFVFDVTAAPSCSVDFVAVGLPSTPVSGGQANLFGVNNLYTEPGGTGFCAGTGPTVKYAYASGTGEVPGNITISQFGTQIAYVENLLTGSSYFHVLTLGTTGNNGTSPTAAAVPGVGNNAVDRSVQLTPDLGTTNQSSTNSPFIVYTNGDVTDYAFVTTYSTASGTGSGYLYKIIGVFGGSTTPRIAWSVPITAVPSSPVYDGVSNKVFFTDNTGRIGYVVDTGTPTAATYSSVLASGTTSANAPVVDGTNQKVYATFNSNGTNAVVVQTSTSLAGTVTVPVGTANTTYGGPYTPDFNNAFYTGIGTPLLYVAGTGSGTTPTLYGVGFTGGALNPSAVQSTPLATGFADSSPVTEFFNSRLNKDFLFVGVTNNCAATTGGGTAGCVLSLDVTSGFPTVSASTTALAAPGGTTGIIVDNNSSVNQASSIYYATKTGSTLVKATQSGLN